MVLEGGNSQYDISKPLGHQGIHMVFLDYQEKNPVKKFSYQKKENLFSLRNSFFHDSRYSLLIKL